jgi:hypothetical protein
MCSYAAPRDWQYGMLLGRSSCAGNALSRLFGNIILGFFCVLVEIIRVWGVGDRAR